MNPEISKIESLCSNMTGAEGCALLATNKTSETTPRCRFASCSEKHSYNCSTSVATSITNQPTKGTTERPGKKNHTQTTQQTGVKPAEVRMEISNLNISDEEKAKDVTDSRLLLSQHNSYEISLFSALFIILNCCYLLLLFKVPYCYYANKTTEEPVKQTHQAQTTWQTETKLTENKMETSNLLDDKQRTIDGTHCTLMLLLHNIV